jgi:hypothetical protein
MSVLASAHSGSGGNHQSLSIRPAESAGLIAFRSARSWLGRQGSTKSGKVRTRHSMQSNAASED